MAIIYTGVTRVREALQSSVSVRSFRHEMFDQVTKTVRARPGAALTYEYSIQVMVCIMYTVKIRENS